MLLAKWRRAALLRLALLLVPAASARDAHAAYLQRLRSETGLSLDGANITVGRDGARIEEALPPQRLALVLAPRWVLTVSKALGGTTYLNEASKKLPQTIPRHFVLAVWVLHMRYISRWPKDELWRLWLKSLPPLDGATVFWSEEELEALEEERIIKRSITRRAQLAKEYEDWVVGALLSESSMEDDLPPGVDIGLEEYLWAVTVVTRYALHLADDFPVLVPLSLRFHPRGGGVLHEWGEEADPGVAIYVGERSLNVGEELTLAAPEQDNLELLLHCGYMWPELSVSRPKIQLSGGSYSEDAEVATLQKQRVAEGEALRYELLSSAGWSARMDFELGIDEGSPGLNSEMLAWLRLVITPAEQLLTARDEAAAGGGNLTADAFRSVRSEATERHVVGTLLTTLSESIGKFDFSLEEDDEILSLASRRGAPLPPRTELAVRYRRAHKEVLRRTVALANEHWADVKRDGSRRRAGRRVSVEVAPGGAASALGEANGEAGGEATPADDEAEAGAARAKPSKPATRKPRRKAKKARGKGKHAKRDRLPMGAGGQEPVHVAARPFEISVDSDEA